MKITDDVLIMLQVAQMVANQKDIDEHAQNVVLWDDAEPITNRKKFLEQVQKLRNRNKILAEFNNIIGKEPLLMVQDKTGELNTPIQKNTMHGPLKNLKFLDHVKNESNLNLIINEVKKALRANEREENKKIRKREKTLRKIIQLEKDLDLSQGTALLLKKELEKELKKEAKNGEKK